MMQMFVALCLLAVAKAVADSAGVRKERFGVVTAHGSVDFGAVAEPKYHLYYFDIRARGEPVRILLQVAGADWEDRRYSLNLTKNAPGDDLLADRASGKLNVSMGLVPMLEIHEPSGKVFRMGESQAIERFIASRHGLMGKDEYEAAQVDMVSEHLRDIGAACSSLGICYHMISLNGPAISRFRNGIPQGDEYKQKSTKFFKEELPAFLEKLEASLPSETLGYAVGSQTSLADVKIFYLVEEALNDKPEEEIQWPPKIFAIAKRIGDLDAVKTHKASRPVRPF